MTEAIAERVPIEAGTKGLWRDRACAQNAEEQREELLLSRSVTFADNDREKTLVAAVL